MAEIERRLSLPGKLEQVRDACDFVVKAAEDAGFGDDGVFQSQLAVEEVFTNIVEHGYGYEGDDKVIEIIAQITPSALVISIVDEAPHFNPLTLESPSSDTPLDERKHGGWGVHFVKQFMDEVNYKLIQNRNSLILKKMRPKPDLA